MKIKDESKLIGLMDKKIKLLSLYSTASNEILNSDIDIITEKFAQRQVLINQIDDLTNQISLLLSKQEQDVGKEIKDILSYKDNNPAVDFKNIYHRAMKIKSILMLISRCEIQINTHIEALKSEMRENMKKSIDNKKIVDYYNTVTRKVIHGTNFNTKK